MKILHTHEAGRSACPFFEKFRKPNLANGRRPVALMILLLLCCFLSSCSRNDCVGLKFFKTDVNNNDKMAFGPNEKATGRLQEKNISNQTNLLSFQLTLENDCQIIAGAPFRLSIESMDPSVLQFEKKIFNKPAENFSFPISVENGKTVISILGNIYFCLKAAVGQCFIRSFNLKIPVTVSESGENILSIEYFIRRNAENKEEFFNGL